tara:strand:+ start:188 stop:385 length:198 start_codon:yes stop_codon:yes gene_type:complete
MSLNCLFIVVATAQNIFESYLLKRKPRSKFPVRSLGLPATQRQKTYYFFMRYALPSEYYHITYNE